MISIADETGSLNGEALALIKSAASSAFAEERRTGGADITAVTAEEMRALNLAHRGIDCVTDVLSFPSAEPGQLPQDGFWGDIVLCPARALEQAEEYGHSFERELAFLTVHGALHLLGYDHALPGEEARMLLKQRAILERMGLLR